MGRARGCRSGRIHQLRRLKRDLHAHGEFDPVVFNLGHNPFARPLSFVANILGLSSTALLSVARPVSAISLGVFALGALADNAGLSSEGSSTWGQTPHSFHREGGSGYKTNHPPMKIYTRIETKASLIFYSPVASFPLGPRRFIIRPENRNHHNLVPLHGHPSTVPQQNERK